MITPTITTQAKPSPNREPTTALVTRSPMSRKPPMAVRMPSATAKILVISGNRVPVWRRRRAVAGAAAAGRAGWAGHAPRPRRH